MSFYKNSFIQIEKNVQYKWAETQTVNAGDNSLTLTNSYIGGELLVYDLEYGVLWEKGVHWNINANTITFTSTIPVDLTFKIINLG